MNDPQKKPTPREELEMRLTALLMGELSGEEASAVEKQMAANPELAALHLRLAKAVELLREASALPEPATPPTPAQLSSDRRARLLAHFKTAAPVSSPATPVPVTQMPRRDWAWIVPMGLAASVIVLLGVGLMRPVYSSTRLSSQTLFIRELAGRSDEDKRTWAWKNGDGSAPLPLQNVSSYRNAGDTR